MGDFILSQENEGLIDQAADVIRGGGLVIVPTETFYALAADPFQEDSVQRIFSVKSRNPEKPLPLIAASRAVLDGVVEPPAPMVVALMDAFWPGSLTILFHPLRKVSSLLSGQTGRIGVRVPPFCAARVLAERCGGWIIATSANLSGDPDPVEVSNIAPQVRQAADLVIDLGPTPGGQPSSVVEVLLNRIRIIREGAVPSSELKKLAQIR
jgi:L-threonylcarbamoyladenylate synthase